MAGKLTLPDQNQTLGRCSRCGAEIKMDPTWYERLTQILRALNVLIP
jgi:hypothetical protein